MTKQWKSGTGNCAFFQKAEGSGVIQSFTLHDAKDLGMGEYQVRFREGPLIQAGISSLAYTLLSLMIRYSKRLFGRIPTTIGQCSRAIKEILIFRRSCKSM